MEFLQYLQEQSQWPVLTALILGLMTAISPCPLATNITAIGYIGKDINEPRQIFSNGLYYTLGRVAGYSSLGLIFILGAEQFSISSFFQTYGEKILGPVLIIAGLFMLDLFSFSGPSFAGLTDRIGKNKTLGKGFSAFLLGVVFSLAFCPYSGALFFGLLVPLSISSTSGVLLPPVFALATALPVIIVAWLLAFSVQKVGTFYNRIQSFEKWFRKVVGILFILAGIYFLTLLF